MTFSCKFFFRLSTALSLCEFDLAMRVPLGSQEMYFIYPCIYSHNDNHFDHKMEVLWTTGLANTYIESLLGRRKFSFTVAHILTAPTNVPSGIARGSVLGSTTSSSSWTTKEVVCAIHVIFAWRLQNIGVQTLDGTSRQSKPGHLSGAFQGNWPSFRYWPLGVGGTHREWNGWCPGGLQLQGLQCNYSEGFWMQLLRIGKLLKPRPTIYCK